MLTVLVAGMLVLQGQGEPRTFPGVEAIAYRTPEAVELLLGRGLIAPSNVNGSRGQKSNIQMLEYQIQKPLAARIKVWFHFGQSIGMDAFMDGQEVSGACVLKAFGIDATRALSESQHGTSRLFKGKSEDPYLPDYRVDLSLASASGTGLDRTVSSGAKLTVLFGRPRRTLTPTDPGSMVLAVRSAMEHSKPTWCGLETRGLITYHHRIFGGKNESSGFDVIWSAMPESAAFAAVNGLPVQPTDLYGEARCFVASVELIHDSEELQFRIGSPQSVLAQLPKLTFNGEKLTRGFVPEATWDVPSALSWSARPVSEGPPYPRGGGASNVAGFWPRSIDRKPIERGQVLHLNCKSNPFYSYSLYVPKNAGKSVPVLINTSPTGDGKPLDTEAADSLGWAMIGLDQAKDGPADIVFGNRAAALIDLQDRIDIDWSRLYFSGFSGGGRAATQAAYAYPGMTKGLICIGAVSDVSGFVSGIPPELLVPASIPIAFIAGDKDMNLFEVSEYASRSKASGRPYFFETFPGPHSWGPKSLIHKAVIWLGAHVQ